MIVSNSRSYNGHNALEQITGTTQISGALLGSNMMGERFKEGSTPMPPPGWQSVVPGATKQSLVLPTAFPFIPELLFYNITEIDGQTRYRKQPPYK